MYVSLDYLCESCLSIEERFVQKHHRDIQACDYCGELMKELPAAPATNFTFADESANKKARK